MTALSKRPSAKREVSSSFKRKLLIILFAVALIPGVTSSFVIYRYVSDKIAVSKLNDLMNIVDAKYVHLLDFLDGEKIFVSGLANNSFIREELVAHYEAIQSAPNQSETLSMEKTGKYLQGLQRGSILDEHAVNQEYRYEEIFVIDTNGKVLASSNRQNTGTDAAQTGFLKRGKTGIFFQDVYRDMDGKSVFGLAAPIYSAKGEVLGVVVTKYSTDFLTALVTGDLGNEIGGKLSFAGYTPSTDFYVVNQDGYMITQSKVLTGVKDTVLKQEAKTLPWQIGIDETRSVRGVHEFYVNYAGREVGGASETIFETKWMVVGEQDKSEILATSTQVMWMIIAVFLIAALLVGALSYYLAGKVSIPIMRLAVATEEVKKGNYDVRVEVKSKDEVGLLAGTFNKMAQQLKVRGTSRC